MSAASDPATSDQRDALALLTTSDPYTSVTASVDFAHLTGDRLVVYGWILGFSKEVDRAFIQIGDTQVDLTAYSRRVRRPDVSRHFSIAPGEEHGFYVMVYLQHPIEDADSLLLSVTLHSGETSESRWVVKRHDPSMVSFPPADMTTLGNMLGTLPALDSMRLSGFLSQDLNFDRKIGRSKTLPPEIKFEVDFCGVLDEQILVVYGSVLDPAERVAAVELAIGTQMFDILKSASYFSRLDIGLDVTSDRRGRPPNSPGFILVQQIKTKLAATSEAIFVIAVQGAEPSYLIRPLCRNAYQSRSELLALISKIEAATGMLLIERISPVIRDLPILQSLSEWLEINHDRLSQGLPPSIHYSSQRARYWLHLDHAVPVAGGGVFLAGWAYAECDPPAKIFCHCGESRVEISADWIRNTRTDVTTYLEAAGVQASDHEHGFTCYVPIHCEEHPYWLSMGSASGEERRMHVPAAGHKRTTLQTVRTLLGSFHSDHRQFLALMDRQIGPAVEAVWSARQKPQTREVVERFGTVPVRPEVSIIVPLYGRWDFAEYQMSQFANDETFVDIDLIYVVDDPSIYDSFRRAAPNLFGVYGIPFSVAFSGTNLGYAVANNFGAGYARGIFILLLNSDVLPKGPGWLRDMLEVYETLTLPGLLGAKLLYEDGTLQHGGMKFRRHSPWGNLWINDHPLKGQMCPELKGTREVAAITAACALIESDLYRELGGLSEDYIIGDFEDSDLCLRAREAGRKNYVALDVELYHLERQSQNRTGDALWRSNLTAYNCWLHNKRWSSAIEEITTAEAPPTLNTRPKEWAGNRLTSFQGSFKEAGLD